MCAVFQPAQQLGEHPQWQQEQPRGHLPDPRSAKGKEKWWNVSVKQDLIWTRHFLRPELFLLTRHSLCKPQVNGRWDAWRSQLSCADPRLLCLSSQQPAPQIRDRLSSHFLGSWLQLGSLDYISDPSPSWNWEAESLEQSPGALRDWRPGCWSIYGAHAPGQPCCIPDNGIIGKHLGLIAQAFSCGGWGE